MKSGAGRDALVAVAFAIVLGALFAPVLFGGRYLTDGGDGITDALSAYLRSPSPWEPSLMLGYPWSSNLNGFWDPLAAVLRAFPHTFNLYMLAAYVIAACGTYRLILAGTGSPLGGFVGGCAYALGGFMIGHLGHYNVVHPAAWTPWVLWSLTRLRTRTDASSIAAGAFAIAFAALAGQPQVLVYTLVAAIALVAVLAPGRAHARTYLFAAAATFGLGLGLAAIALVPGARLAELSLRARMTFDQFVSFSNPPQDVVIRLFFPYFLGLARSPVYPFSGFDFGGWPELSNYVGLTTLVLAVIAALSGARDRLVRYWIAVAVAGLALSAGDGFKLAAITYHVPVLNVFRAQGRHALEATLALAVLAGYGVAAISRQTVRPRTIAGGIGLVGGALALALGLLAAGDGPFAAEVVARAGLPSFPLDPVHNPALGIPVVVFLAGATAIAVWSRLPAARAARALLLAAVLADLGSFAGFGAWRNAVVTPAQIAPPPAALALRAELARSHERVMFVPSGATWGPLDPDRAVLWQLPVASGHVQLVVARTAAFLGLDADGRVSAGALGDAAQRRLALAAVRYIVLPPGSLGVRPIAAPWDAAGLDVRIGSPAWRATTWVGRSDLRVRFARPIRVSRVLLESSLSDAVPIEGGTRVAELVLSGADGRETVLPLRAGRETAERGYDRPNVRPFVRHPRAAIMASDGLDHAYLAALAPPQARSIVAAELRWTGPDPVRGYLNLDRLTFLDDGAHLAYPLAPRTLLELANAEWRRDDRDPAVVRFANRHPLGRAWLVHRVVARAGAAALRAVDADGFDPAHTAIVEDAPPSAAAGTGAANDGVPIAAIDATRMTLAVRCATGCYVVTSDAYDAGWSADVDGARTRIYPTDYALRGVFVPAGRHTLTFSYVPAGLRLGAAIAGLALLVLIVLSIPPVGRRVIGPAR